MADAGAKRPFLRWMLLFGVIFTAALVTVGVALRPRHAARPPLPDPNGFDDLVRAGEMIQGKAPADLLKADEAALRAFVEPNGEALARARVGLGRPCVIPVDYASRDMTRNTEWLMRSRSVSRLLIAEGRLAERESRVGDAAHSFRDDIRLGTSLRGGLLIDQLVGFACEHGGVEGLNRLVDRLDAKQCRELIAELGPIERDREAVRATIARDQEWSETSAGWRERLAMLVNAKALLKLAQPAYTAAETASRKARLRMRTLLAMLAIRAYRLERGETPTTMAALVPDYLDDLPRDPDDGKPFRLGDEPGDGIRIDLDPPSGPEDEPIPTGP